MSLSIPITNPSLCLPLDIHDGIFGRVSAGCYAKTHAERVAITHSIREAVHDLGFFFAGDVEVAMEWTMHERVRYFSPNSPDVDNVMKVVIDALCGPTGIIINDHQVQSVSCHWTDWTLPKHQIRITVRTLLPDQWLPKAGLVFVHIRNNLCFPFVLGIDTTISLEAVVHMVETYEKLFEITSDHYAAKSVLPQQQLFHSSLLHGFQIIDQDTFKQAAT